VTANPAKTPADASSPWDVSAIPVKAGDDESSRRDVSLSEPSAALVGPLCVATEQPTARRPSMLRRNRPDPAVMSYRSDMTGEFLAFRVRDVRRVGHAERPIEPC
jgi:hypothetical protein